MKTFLAALALMTAAAGPALARADDGVLRLTVEGAEPRGAVMMALFDSEAAWDGGEAVALARVDVAAGETVAVFEGLAAGDYGVKAFHDLDGDGRMSVNPFGVPTEPFAFSNGARGAMGPAPWSAARVRVEGETLQSLAFRRAEPAP